MTPEPICVRCGKLSREHFGQWCFESESNTSTYCPKGEQSEAPAAPTADKVMVRFTRRMVDDGRTEEIRSADGASEVSAPSPTIEQQVAALTADNERLTKERDAFRFRLYFYKEHTGTSHTTACSIWREDGNGHAEGFDGYMGPCNCGALRNFERYRADKAEADNELLRGALQEGLVISDGLLMASDFTPADSIRIRMEKFVALAREALKK